MVKMVCEAVHFQKSLYSKNNIIFKLFPGFSQKELQDFSTTIPLFYWIFQDFEGQFSILLKSSEINLHYKAIFRKYLKEDSMLV